MFRMTVAIYATGPLLVTAVKSLRSLVLHLVSSVKPLELSFREEETDFLRFNRMASILTRSGKHDRSYNISAPKLQKEKKKINHTGCNNKRVKPYTNYTQEN